MSVITIGVRLGIGALAATTVTVGLSAPPVGARAAAPADVAPRLLTGAVDNSDFDSQYTALGKRVVFAGFDSKDNYGSEPWITDGTPTGTHRIKAIIADTHSHLTNLTAAGAKVFFTVVDDNFAKHEPWELWVTNGKARGTKLLHSFPQTGTSLIPNHLTAVGKRLFFNASSATGRQLWVSNGKKAGTKKVKAFPDDGSTFQDVAWSMTSLGGKLYFPAEDSTHGIELWSSDGTAAGTTMAVDVVSGASASDPTSLMTFKSRLYFTAAGSGGLYTSDGTAGGTTQLKPGGSSITAYLPDSQPLNGNLFVYGNVSGANGFLVTNGTQGGTTFQPLPAGLLDEGTFGSVGNEVLFDARMTGTNDDEELWGTDGTTAGTHLVKDIYPGNIGSAPTNLTSIGKRVVFDAQIPNTGDQLFVSDGTAGGTHRLGYRVEDSATLNLVYRAGMVFFDGPDSVYYQPWVWEPGPRYLSWCTLKVAKKFAHGKSPKATAKVGSSASLKGTRVQLYDGKKKLGSKRLSHGKGVFRLPAGLKVGHHKLRVQFPRHGKVQACAATRRITVTR